VGSHQACPAVLVDSHGGVEETPEETQAVGLAVESPAIEGYWADDPNAPAMIRAYLVHAETQRVMRAETIVFSAVCVETEGRHRMPRGWSLKGARG
jgi:hypothetical protein